MSHFSCPTLAEITLRLTLDSRIFENIKVADYIQINPFLFADTISKRSEELLLTDEEFENLRKSRAQMLEIMNPRGSAALYSMGCITSAQQEHIRSKSSWREKNEILLDVITRKSHGNYVQFLQWLRDDEQRHVAAVLQHGGCKCWSALIMSLYNGQNRKCCD